MSIQTQNTARNVKVKFTNGFERIISIEGSDQEVESYFVGKVIDIGILHGECESEFKREAIKVEFPSHDVEFTNPFAFVNKYTMELVKYERVIIQSTPTGEAESLTEQEWLKAATKEFNIANEAVNCCHDVFENISDSEILDYPNCFNKVWELGKKLDAYLPKTGGG